MTTKVSAEPAAAVDARQAAIDSYRRRGRKKAFAKWIHPEQFADLNPTQDFKDFHKEWLPFDYSGAFFIDPANPEES